MAKWLRHHACTLRSRGDPRINPGCGLFFFAFSSEASLSNALPTIISRRIVVNFDREGVMEMIFARRNN